jgi:23S rRNA (uracil1939-C5)-methyltransferase
MRARTTSTPSSSGARRPGSTPSAAEPAQIVTVERVGLDGDGVGHLADKRPAYLPFTLPGERVRATPSTRRGEGVACAAEVLDASPDRAAPPCPHFFACGGCSLQHWADAPYAAWKRAIPALGVEPAPLARTPPGARRRIDLALRRDRDGRILAGLHRRGSREIVDMHACTVLDPRLFALVAPLRAMLRGLAALRADGSAVLNLLDTGPDLLLRTDAELTAADRTRLAAFAQAQRVPRIAWARGSGPPETAAQLGPVGIRLGPAEVAPPPGAFLQASPQGEAAIRDAVLAGLPARLAPRAPIVELYAGCGTLTFALAERARVVAYEGDATAVATLRRVGQGRVDVRQRDLTRQPLQASELRGAAAVVLDPPWAGAAPQMPGIAVSGIPTIIYVSCDPAALARDARPLLAAGYRVESVTPVDQFLWSARVEAVAVFRAAAFRSR